MTLIELEVSRAKRLKAATHEAHERLDTRIMAANPFATREHYALFVKVQHQFHRDIDALYENRDLDRMLPDLAARRRLPMIVQDLMDLGMATPAPDGAPAFGASIDIPTALGWLYVAEGSNLGAALLLKEAIKLNLHETFGARHLAAAPEGRGLHWRTFTAALDEAEFSAADEQNVISGAVSAFTRVRGLVDTLLPLPSSTETSAIA